MPAAAADVGNDVEPREVVGGHHAGDLGVRLRRHRLAENARLVWAVDEVREYPAGRHDFNRRPPGAQRVCEMLRRGEDDWQAHHPHESSQRPRMIGAEQARWRRV